MPFKPFKWNLKKVSMADEHLLDSLFCLLPATAARERIVVEIRKVLMKHLGEKAFFYLESVQTKQYAAFLSERHESAITAQIGMEPIPHKGIIEIDPNLGFLLIERLLGGSGTPSIENRPLTETEKGVIQYLIMQIMAVIWQTMGKAANVHFRFEKFVSDINDIGKIAPGKDTATALIYKVGIGELSGFVKLLFPKAFVEKAILTSKSAEDDGDYFRGRISRYGYIQTTLWAEAGRTFVAPQELVALENGDVILFDDTGVFFADGVLKGEAALRVGGGETGGIKTSVETSGRVVKCTVIGT